MVTAVDYAGNTGTATKTYSPIYGVCPQFDVTKPFGGGGNTIPLKIQLCDGAGANLSSRQITLIAVALDSGLAPPYAGASNAPYEFRFQQNPDGYIYNFKPLTPLAPGTHTLWFVIKGDTSGQRYAIVFLTN